jgi:uncharacterized protein
VRFWDSSALLSLLAGQPGSLNVMPLMDDDPGVVVWWGTSVELVSGICRLRCEALIDDTDLAKLLSKVEKVTLEADQVEPTEEVRQAAIRALRVHNLRAADAMQLASALAWTEHKPTGTGFVCLDKQLREAAGREGFIVLPE